MSLTSDTGTPKTRKLDADTIAALVAAVSAAKARGWTQDHFKRWFKARGVEGYKQAVAGEDIPAEVAGALGAISVHGLPDWPHAPNPDDIAWHIEWLVSPARSAYDDALIEIAHDMPGEGLKWARLFGLDELKQALEFAVSKNLDGCNVYIGAALRLPDAHRFKRASDEDFYVATAVPIDIDKDYDATRAAMAAVCEDGCVVTTGLTPQRRSQHWTRLTEPCDSDLEFAHAFRGLVEHVGADMAVKDAARVMRLGGTIAFPNARKVGLGYCIELTSTTLNDAAKPSALETLKALAPGAGPSERRDYSDRPQAEGITRAGILGSGKVTDGRERFFATKLLPRVIRQWQQETGCDPTADELFAEAFVLFEAEADNSDGRWTSADGQRELRARAANTIRRLRIGRMARIGLASIDTGEGQAEAEAAQAKWEETRHRPQASDQGGHQDPAADEAQGRPLWDLRAWHASVYSGPAPEIRWLCEGTIPLGIPVLFASMGGLGKSFIAIDLGLAIAVEVVAGLSSRPILGGEVVQTGTAVILSAEDSKDSIHRRLEKIDPEGKRHAAPERLIIVPLPDAGGPKPLIASDGKTLSMTPAFHALKAELMEIPDLKVIVIDPLQAFVLADVNSDPAAGQYMWSAFASLCAATGATLIIPHHMRKDGAASIKNADQAREAIRGSTALVDGARLAYALWKADAEDGREMCARLDVDFAPERIAFGAVVKANDQANREVQTYVRQASGLLTDQSNRVMATKAQQAVSMSQCQEIVAEIGKAWDAAREGRGEGYAMSPQSGDRQAWRLIQRRTGCPAREAKELAAAWVANRVLEMQTTDPKRHRSALRLVGRLG